MSVNIDIRGDGGSPTLTTSRMSVYFVDTCIISQRGGPTSSTATSWTEASYIYIYTHVYVYIYIYTYYIYICKSFYWFIMSLFILQLLVFVMLLLELYIVYIVHYVRIGVFCIYNLYHIALPSAGGHALEILLLLFAFKRDCIL